MKHEYLLLIGLVLLLTVDQADLSKVDRERTPWIIVLFHAPWYNTNEAHQGEGDEMMSSMEPLLYDAGVDIVFAGHVHAYERSVLSRFYSYIPGLISVDHFWITVFV